MTHPITSRWPAANPDAIQFYSLPTPNGIKVSAMLEETGLDYEPHLVNILQGDQHSDAFSSLNPNQKIPAIIDPNGPGGEPLALWESGAILVYLAEKTGRFVPNDPSQRLECLQWVMWQMGGVGPMFGQFGFFNTMGGKDWEDKRPLERYRDETIRLLKVLDGQLDGQNYLVGNDYTIADMAIWPWVVALEQYHKSFEALGVASSRNILNWLELTANRTASMRAMNIPAME